MKTPLVAHIKRNALDDGPGIRAAVFFKGCPLCCAWCHNPECLSAAPELAYRASACIDCRDCAAACPDGAIGPGGPAELDRGRCRLSGACVDACPSGALELVGQRYGVAELAASLLRDLPVYRASGGGVTLTGGEATLYPEFVGRLAAALRGENVHLLLETCGHFDWTRVAAELLPQLSAVYFDLKIVDRAAHARHCGRDNTLILANLDRLLAAAGAGGPDLLVRIPLVPGLTDTAENLQAAAELLRRRGVGRLSLLPYNPLWGPKATAVGRGGPPTSAGWQPAVVLERCRAHFDGLKLV